MARKTHQNEKYMEQYQNKVKVQGREQETIVKGKTTSKSVLQYGVWNDKFDGIWHFKS